MKGVNVNIEIKQNWNEAIYPISYCATIYLFQHFPVVYNGQAHFKNLAVNISLNLQSILLQQKIWFFVIIPTCGIGRCFFKIILYSGWYSVL